VSFPEKGFVRVNRITQEDLLRSKDLRFEFFRSSGPGGQNVNKVSSGVRLRFDVAGSCLLPEDVKERLARRACSRMTDEGVLLIEAKRFRTQERNRQDALYRLMRLISSSWEKPCRRTPTVPTEASKRRRIQKKKQRGELKRGRGRVEEKLE
jgi:ribosome-associated protein